MVRTYALGLSALLLACGNDSGSGGSTSGGSPATGGSGGDGGAVTDVALIDIALAGNCPGGDEPDNGVAPGNDLHKVTLDDHPDALCNDGSPAIMYVRRSSAPEAANAWVIHLQAGGGCSSWEVCRDRWCSYETTYDAAKMSSTFAPEVAAGTGLFARSAANTFGVANQVYVYYCSSDTWLGRRSDVVFDDPDGEGPSYRLHFRGFDIIQAVVAELKAGAVSDDGEVEMPSLEDAERVLLSGSSAGAAGQTHALDWWRGELEGAAVYGVFDAITDPLFEDIADPDIASAFEDGIRFVHDTTYGQTYDAHLDESCVAAHPGEDAHLCALSSHVRLNHVTTPFFVRQDLRDTVQYNYFAETGATLDEMAEALEATMERFPLVPSEAEEADAIERTPSVHVSNCRQHIVMLNGPWFGVAADNNASVELPGGEALTVHDGLVRWLFANEDVAAIDEHPSVRSVCVETTPDQ